MHISQRAPQITSTPEKYPCCIQYNSIIEYTPVLTQKHLFNLPTQALHMQKSCKWNQRVKLYTAQQNVYNPGSSYWMTGEHFQSCRGGDIPAKQDTAGKSELLLTSHCTKLIQVNSIVNEITTKLNLSVTRKITGPGLWVGGITYTNQSQHFFLIVYIECSS